MKISVVYFRKGGEVEGAVDGYFVASRNPFYLGIIMKPSTGVWEILKSSSFANLRINGNTMLEFSIAYMIEVGENTIFFMKPQEGSEVQSEEIFLRSEE